MKKYLFGKERSVDRKIRRNVTGNSNRTGYAMTPNEWLFGHSLIVQVLLFSQEGRS